MATVEQRQTRLAANGEAIERWQRKLFRAANELQKLAAQRRRLLYPNGRRPKFRELEDIPHYVGGGNDFHSDDIPI